MCVCSALCCIFHRTETLQYHTKLTLHFYRLWLLNYADKTLKYGRAQHILVISVHNYKPFWAVDKDLLSQVSGNLTLLKGSALTNNNTSSRLSVFLIKLNLKPSSAPKTHKPTNDPRLAASVEGCSSSHHCLWFRWLLRFELDRKRVNTKDPVFIWWSSLCGAGSNPGTLMVSTNNM